MHNNESITNYNVRFLDIANESFALGEKISKERLVRKQLRSLPKGFDMKLTTIEEAQDITSMKFNKIFGALFTFEMSLDRKPEKKNKGIAL